MARQDGRVALSDLAARLAGAGPRVLVPFDRPAGWWRASDGLSDQGAALVPGADPSPDGRPTTSVLVQLGVGPAAVRPPPGTQPLPALVSSPLLQRLGLALGQPFFLDIRSTRVRVEAVAAAEWFPTLAPTARRLLRDLGDLLADSRAAAILVTHDRHVERHVDRVVQIRDGRISIETRWDGEEGRQPTELVVLDRAGRLQVPRDYLQRLGVRDRVRMVLEEDHLRIFPVD